MAVNQDKPGRWKADVARSVDMYNDWFMKFAPKAFRETRIQTTKWAKNGVEWAKNAGSKVIVGSQRNHYITRNPPPRLGEWAPRSIVLSHDSSPTLLSRRERMRAEGPRHRGRWFPKSRNRCREPFR